MVLFFVFQAVRRVFNDYEIALLPFKALIVLCYDSFQG